MQIQAYDGDTFIGTITDVLPFQTLTDTGVKNETRKAATSVTDDESFIFWTESAARFWLWLKYKTGE